MVRTAATLAEISDRIAGVRFRIDAAARRGHRLSSEIKLLAVSKSHPPEIIKQAIAAGVSDLGENRVQEAEQKIAEVGRSSARWHLIGHLQSNKARAAVKLFDVIHSLDSAALARRLARICAEENRRQLPVLLQLNLAGEASKSGIEEKELPRLVEVVMACSHLSLTGLMTVPPFFENREQVRPMFRRLREILNAIFVSGPRPN